MHTSGNSSIDTSLIHDIYCGPEVLFETCVALKFMDDDDDDDDVNTLPKSSYVNRNTGLNDLFTGHHHPLASTILKCFVTEADICKHLAKE